MCGRLHVEAALLQSFQDLAAIGWRKQAFRFCGMLMVCTERVLAA
jgi:hypothetical protein